MAFYGYLVFYGDDDKLIGNSGDSSLTLKVPANSGMTKMKNWNGWVDRYYYLSLGEEENDFHSKEHFVSFKRFNKNTILKLYEVRQKTYDVGGKYNICVFKNENGDPSKISLRCQDIEKVKKYNDEVSKALKQIKDKGNAIIFRAPLNHDPSKITVKSEEELWPALAIGTDGFDLSFKVE